MGAGGHGVRQACRYTVAGRASNLGWLLFLALHQNVSTQNRKHIHTPQPVRRVHNFSRREGNQNVLSWIKNIRGGRRFFTPEVIFFLCEVQFARVMVLCCTVWALGRVFGNCSGPGVWAGAGCGVWEGAGPGVWRWAGREVD